jgi:drug/metabolite transporter (DMT)-like permease
MLARSRSAAYAALVVTSALWGSNAVVARGLLDSMSATQLAFARWLVVLVALAPFAWVEREDIRRALRTDARAYAILALLGFAPQTLVVYSALAHTTAVVIGLLNSAIPVLIVAVAAVWHSRRPHLLEGAGLAISSVGVLTIVAQGDLAALLALRFNGADLLAFVGMFIWALYTLRLARRPRGLSLPALVFVCGAIGELVIVPLAVADALRHGVATLGGATALGVVYIGLLPSLGAALLYGFGVTRLGAVRAGIFTHLVPVFSALFATTFLGERLYGFHAVGFVLVAGGAIVCCMTPGPMLSSARGARPDAATS